MAIKKNGLEIYLVAALQKTSWEKREVIPYKNTISVTLGNYRMENGLDLIYLNYFRLAGVVL